MPDSLHLSKPSLAYAKLVATPNETSWSQVYNAGNLFACVSLTIPQGGDASLATIGKEVLDTLQAEFFVLEEKTLPSITDVMHKSLQNVPEEVNADMTVGFFKDSLLYLFIVGHGRVLMKRQGKIGVLLQGNPHDKKVLTASGYLNNEDTVVLETKQFAEDINDATLTSALELGLPNDIAEALSPQLHAREDGGQAAIIVVYHGVSKGMITQEPQDVPQPGPEMEKQHEHYDNLRVPEETPIHHAQEDAYDEEEGEASEEAYAEEEESETRRAGRRAGPSFSLFGKAASKLHLPKAGGLSHTRKLFLSISIILIVLLAASIFFTKKKESDAKQQELFAQVYQPALDKYEGAKALETLNKDVSYDDYLEAKKLLAENKDKFPPDSKERKQIDELLGKIEAELANESPVQSAKEASVGENSLLAVEKANKDGKGFTQDDTAVYFVTDKAVFSVSKSSGAKKEIIKNNNIWSDAVGISTYLGNLYVLDRKNGIFKFASGGYAQSSYFKDKPDLSTARDLAIDSAVWILLQDGTILKYTSGVSDGYKAPKLEKPMSGPAKIFTDANTTNVYVLDRGNSRVVRIAKEGSGHSEYTSSAVKNASDFEVREKDKKILILSGGKTYEIAL